MLSAESPSSTTWILSKDKGTEMKIEGKEMGREEERKRKGKGMKKGRKEWEERGGEGSR